MAPIREGKLYLALFRDRSSLAIVFFLLFCLFFFWGGGWPLNILNLELFSTAYELEPGEIPPFPIRYCQTDELEPGEIRPYPVSKTVCNEK